MIITTVFLSSLLAASITLGDFQDTTSVSSQDNGSQDFTLDSLPNSLSTSARSSNNSTSQLAWEWASSAGDYTDDYGFDITTSQTGHQFIIGQFKGTISFGGLCPTLGTYGNTVSNLYVGKFDSNGSCKWVEEVYDSSWHTGIMGGAIAVDSNENVYITSDFENNVTMGNISLSRTGNQAFVAKLDQNGTWLWATPLSYGTSVSNGGRGYGVDTDANGNVFFVGESKGQGYDYGFIVKLNSSGVIQWQNDLGGNQGSSLSDTAVDSNGNLYVTGWFKGSLSVQIGGVSESFTSSHSGGYKNSMLVGKLNNTGDWLWLEHTKNATQSIGSVNSIAINSNDEIYVVGSFWSNVEFGPFTLSTGGTENGFIVKLNSSGDWKWAKKIDCSCITVAYGVNTDAIGNAYIIGKYKGGTVNIGSVFLSPTGGGYDIFVYKVDASGNSQWAQGAGGTAKDVGNSISVDQLGTVYTTGSFGTTADFSQFSLTTQGSSDMFYAKLSSDYDSDGNADVNDEDDDDDYILDAYDLCQYSEIGFRSVGTFDHDSDGCRDADEDEDDDNDGLNDDSDNCSRGMIGWISTNVTDYDSDGCNDALEDQDDDSDGIEDYLDLCPRSSGNSTFEFEMGCRDDDGDGRPNIRDPFPHDPTEWSDLDGDGTGDNADEFDADSTQQTDTDGDGYGDYEYGNGGDGCPNVWGDSLIDLLGCVDSDGDGWSDQGDALPQDSTQWLDRDGDHYGDNDGPNATNVDAFPSDGTQWSDSDGDGHGDNPYGTEGDWFPNDPTRWADSDRDGVADEDDDFVNDASQWLDSDNDGHGDNPAGNQPDSFPNNPYEWIDTDGDGIGNNDDAFPFDSSQNTDRDGDGYGDNLAGRLPDLFPDNPTQWEDIDGDGLGDNQSGTAADPYLNDYDNDGYNDSIDILPKLASPGDLDNDGCLDEEDTFPLDYKECSDFDGDGEGDNADTDDDNDGWTDVDEDRQETDPLDPLDYPIEAFQLMVPGTTIGLDGWDLIGIFGGVPLFAWITFGLVTRNRRCLEFEVMLSEARTKQELEDIALKAEHALMIRLLGPHQGIRLERLRAELDDALDGEGMNFNENQTDMVEQELKQMDLHEEIPEREFADYPAGPPASIVAEGMTSGKNNSEATPPSLNAVGIVDQDDYEWLQQGGATWYRATNSGSDWEQWLDD